MEIDFEKPKWLGQTAGILETLNEGVIITDDCHRILFVNSGFVEMAGMTREDVIGKVASQFYSAKEWEFVLEQVDIASRFSRNRYGFVLPRKDGSRLPVLVGVRVWEDPGGQKLRVVTLTDVSELKEAEDRLRETNHCLQKTSRNEGFFPVVGIDCVGDLCSGHSKRPLLQSIESFY